MTTIKQFVNRHGIKIRSEWADSNPHMDNFEGNHFKVTLTRRENGSSRQMTLHFSQGYGISGEPTAESVLECLAMDSDVIGRDFEDWASDLGYDPDSRKAERIFRATQKQSAALERFLGDIGIQALTNCEF